MYNNFVNCTSFVLDCADTSHLVTQKNNAANFSFDTTKTAPNFTVCFEAVRAIDVICTMNEQHLFCVELLALLFVALFVVLFVVFFVVLFLGLSIEQVSALADVRQPMVL